MMAEADWVLMENTTEKRLAEAKAKAASSK